VRWEPAGRKVTPFHSVRASGASIRGNELGASAHAKGAAFPNGGER
jgi:hypothetical protein